MIKMKIPLYTIRWTQTYTNWEPLDFKSVEDLTEARAVLERIMAL